MYFHLWERRSRHPPVSFYRNMKSLRHRRGEAIYVPCGPKTEDASRDNGFYVYHIATELFGGSVNPTANLDQFAIPHFLEHSVILGPSLFLYGRRQYELRSTIHANVLNPVQGYYKKNNLYALCTEKSFSTIPFKPRNILNLSLMGAIFLPFLAPLRIEIFANFCCKGTAAGASPSLSNNNP